MLWITFALLSVATAEPVTFLSAVPPYTKCMESVLTWQGGAPPYSVKAKADGNFRLIQQHWNDTTYKFFVDFEEGRNLDIFIEDSSGETGEAGQNSLKSTIRSNEGQTCPLYVFPADRNSTSAPATVTVTATPSADSTDETAKAGGSGSRSMSTGQILGIVGGVIGVLIIVGLLFWIWRLQKRLQSHETRIYETVVDHTVHPYIDIDRQPQVREQPPAPGPQQSPDTKALQLNTMFGSQAPTSPRFPPSSSSAGYLQEQNTWSPAVSVPLSPSTRITPRSSSQAQRTQQSPQSSLREEDQESEYAEDGGPAFAPPPRTVHPPHYRDTWKS